MHHGVRTMEIGARIGGSTLVLRPKTDHGQVGFAIGMRQRLRFRQEIRLLGITKRASKMAVVLRWKHRYQLLVQMNQAMVLRVSLRNTSTMKV